MSNIQSQAKLNVQEGDTQVHQDASLLSTQLIRPCNRYEDEYEQCKSSKSRRQQIFVHGAILDCEPWAKDFANCQKWTWHGDEAAASAIIENERQRLEERLVPHLSSKVWTKRDKPPEDWNKPLPEFEKLTKNSYLALISKGGEEAVSFSNACSIQ